MPSSRSVSAVRLAERMFAATGYWISASEGAICVEVVQEAVDGGGLLSRFADVAAHQFACPSDGFGTDVLTQLTNQLRTQQLDLLGALHLDPLDFRVGLGTQLLDDALGVGLRFFGNPLGLRLSVFLRLLVRATGFRESISGGRGVRQLLAHSVLLVRHHLAYRRHDIAPDQPHDDGEPDELPDEC